ncbi:type IV pilin protein [Noviherbaspirillum pedocola]|uniref:Prepilin-type N-terminal cleavage/methylation domain-containing protein n=1 Tax=Noviherbaspirillum pedocola TaxID=2801341 RepID=A0A934W583_9BURK|nr:type IV pilin protein [Noviherbaspirillum pedocola]MBK4733600.1 prepilin-type N-terminal cleavage/methylation domain-containing protein [Noviherbaspirillum pedocola]
MRPGADRRGFSLAELAAVLALAALLAWMGARSWQDLVRTQRRAEGRSALARAMQAQEHYFSRYGRYRAYDVAAPAGFPWHSGPTPAASAYLLSAVACSDAPLEDCVQLRAEPGASAFRDSECGMLMLDSRGRQGAQGEGGRCW